MNTARRSSASSCFAVASAVRNRALLLAVDHDRVGGHWRAVCTKVKIQMVSARTS
ncbi:hypothetical protein [Variovorax beijingensis]|uniref:hypothetical protein n=1 Tax=Variovorax beijingensis TaxID=2496117 RepID=UPI0013E0AB68|nr:hypothetical protein [Variovorax beijingensis]